MQLQEVLIAQLTCFLSEMVRIVEILPNKKAGSVRTYN